MSKKIIIKITKVEDEDMKEELEFLKEIEDKEFMKDCVTFNHLIEFIEICHEYELNCKNKLTIDFYNKTVYEIDKLADKYGLHNEKRFIDPWYELYDLWPRMKEFFN